MAQRVTSSPRGIFTRDVVRTESLPGRRLSRSGVAGGPPGTRSFGVDPGDRPGRGILETGCEVVVLSNEECGLPISDAACEPLGATGAAILAELRRASPPFSIYSFIENTGDARNRAVSTAQLASILRLSVSGIRDELSRLERRGLVCKIGERGGWSLVSHPAPERTEPESEGPATADSSQPQGDAHALERN